MSLYWLHGQDHVMVLASLSGKLAVPISTFKRASQFNLESLGDTLGTLTLRL
jgi:hypothetical protein